MQQNNKKRCSTCGNNNEVINKCDRGGADICKDCCESKDHRKHKAGYRSNCNCDTDSYSW